MTDTIFIVTEPFSDTWCLMKGAIVILEETTPTNAVSPCQSNFTDIFMQD